MSAYMSAYNRRSVAESGDPIASLQAKSSVRTQVPYKGMSEAFSPAYRTGATCDTVHLFQCNFLSSTIQLL